MAVSTSANSFLTTIQQLNAQSTASSSREWGFDFSEGAPLPQGPYSWSLFQPEERPQLAPPVLDKRPSLLDVFPADQEDQAPENVTPEPNALFRDRDIISRPATPPTSYIKSEQPTSALFFTRNEGSASTLASSAKSSASKATGTGARKLTLFTNSLLLTRKQCSSQQGRSVQLV